MEESESRGYRFGAFRLDPHERVLLCNGLRVPLPRKALELLLLLVAQPGRTLSKIELMDALWPHRAVHTNSLPVAVNALRSALSTRMLGAQFVETVPRRGYRFVGAVQRTAAPLDTPSPVPRPGPRAAAQGAPEVFVGRTRELQQLLLLFEQAREGRGQLALIRGAAGMGKSALVRCFARGLAEGGHTARIATGRCLESHGSSAAYLPILDALAGLLAGPHGASLEAQLELHAPGWCESFPELFADGGSHRAPSLEAASRESLPWQLARALSAWSSAQPVVLVLEDLHWADPSSLDLLRLLCAHCRTERLLVLGTFRPRAPGLSGEATPSESALEALSACALSELAHEYALPLLALVPLDLTELVSYLDACLPENELTPSLPELFLRKTGGVPLFAARWLQVLRERGQLAQRGRWVLARDISELEGSAPDSLEAVIRHGLAHLPTTIQQALAFASVEGDEFRTCVLAEALPGSTLELARELAELARRDGWLVHVGQEELPDGVLTERYRFAHVLYQNVLYDGLSRQRRISLHRRAALTLEAHGCGRHSRFLAELAWHQERGRRFSRAVATLISAAEHAARIAAPREALLYHARARTLLAQLPQSEQPTGLQLLHRQQELPVPAGL